MTSNIIKLVDRISVLIEESNRFRKIAEKEVGAAGHLHTTIRVLNSRIDELYEELNYSIQ